MNSGRDLNSSKLGRNRSNSLLNNSRSDDEFNNVYNNYYLSKQKRSSKSLLKRFLSCKCIKPAQIAKHLRHIVKSCFTRRPYFAFAFTLLSFPLSLIYFSVIYLGCLIGALLTPLFIGMFFLAFIALLGRCFMIIELFLCRHLLCMSQKIASPHIHMSLFSDLISGVKSLFSRSKINMDEQGDLLSNEDLDVPHASPIANNRRASRFQPPNTTLPSTSYDRDISLATQDPTFINENYFKTPTGRSVEFFSPTSPMKQLLQNATMDESFHHYDSDYSDDSVDSIHSPTSHNSYYYQHYGAMLGRSLDQNSSSLPRTTTLTNRTAKSATTNTNQPPEDVINVADHVEKVPDEKEEKKAGYWENMKKFYSLCYKFTFCREMGFAILYFTMKVPIALLSFFISMLFVAIPISAIVFPLFHIICSTSSLSSTPFCLTVMSEQLQGDWVYIGWIFWFVYSIPGNILIALFAIVTLPFCIYGMRFVTRFNRDAVLLLNNSS